MYRIYSQGEVVLFCFLGYLIYHNTKIKILLNVEGVSVWGKL